MDKKDKESVRGKVRERYGAIAREKAAQGCIPSTSCCGGGGGDVRVDAVSLAIGYKKEDLAGIPDGANMGLGCGNPQTIASLKPGDIVLDLGAGGGFDAFLAARQVGGAGRVIGVDMTADMVAKARKNAAGLGLANVEFRLGEIEHLPVADASVDVIISNCVINLSPEKGQVFRDAFRALKPGGRIAVSDVVSLAPLPPHLHQLAELYTGCVTGAATPSELEALLKEAGFTDVRLAVKGSSREVIAQWAPGTGAENYVASADITAVKPEGK